ncbi:uracil-DNA glycosylase family protein [Methylocapsa sp. S129]|uniref:uracil-DNA glycosylase family protein n=1 Tax=Methylocapsa sp. S129 TaxID=1641869 RepID=UPI00131A75A9|nr:uracil-DNA glycosylase family protein [Methylocapsa sp. S129]
MTKDAVLALRAEIASCVHCAADLPAGPRPVVQFSATARILIIGQAPGTRVHASGVPWDDPSGDRLREWTGLSKRDFYDPAKIALVPMGFCYPGKGKSGDLPPRAECAPLWHDRILKLLPADRLTLLVGSYAQAYYLPRAARLSLTETVQAFRTFGPALFPLPHPSWRSVGWAKRNPWFESDVLPALREAVRSSMPPRGRIGRSAEHGDGGVD